MRRSGDITGETLVWLAWVRTERQSSVARFSGATVVDDGMRGQVYAPSFNPETFDASVEHTVALLVDAATVEDLGDHHDDHSY